jgi:hypothetical protein
MLFGKPDYSVGSVEGSVEGSGEGSVDGSGEGSVVGSSDGGVVGSSDGGVVGSSDGGSLGSGVGVGVGVGAGVGRGDCVGGLVGAYVGGRTGSVEGRVGLPGRDPLPRSIPGRGALVKLLPGWSGVGTARCLGVYVDAGGGVYVNRFGCCGPVCTSTVPLSPGPDVGSRFSSIGGSPCSASGADAGPADVSRSWSVAAGCTATAPTIPAVSTKAAAVPVTIKRLRTLSSPCGFRYCLVPFCHDVSVAEYRTAKHPPEHSAHFSGDGLTNHSAPPLFEQRSGRDNTWQNTIGNRYV